ncbi:hypothetical protein EXE51_08325 [Halorubrum sp. CGM5_25_10-8B]|uniref:hypothetical protein n=1 Tax=Halorubrum sp. CGM5_25_10-8B TaxID=2518115 RepID=UPI0010F9CED4|nr:hypothetical protein [Halorubrum sp. CGM5_25_10-8B]TKX37067.1 hypothetical protein EXE51_08325 [Halorubrum sp. CGM5_25_10-8B]
MATLQVSTTSNVPTVDPDRVDELRSFLDEWLLGTGPFDTLTVDVVEPDRDPDTGERPPPYLVLYGYASFGPVHRPTVRHAAYEQLDAASDLEGLSDADREALIDAETEDLVYDYQHEHTEDFLRELVAYLVEPFIVQTAGYEKCRFPLVGYQYSVDLDGEIDHVSLS